ncbi:MAG: hypothetical protein Gyms2KO_23460 [Gymnodinialimonas sp.]
MSQYLSRDWYDLGVEHVPVAKLDAAGRVRIVYPPIWQSALQESGFQVFLPDDYMINAATLAVLDLAQHAGKAANVPVAFALLDALDADFSSAVCERFPATLNISTPYDTAHTFLPQDIHPNVRANRLFADRLARLVTDLCQGVPTGQPA